MKFYIASGIKNKDNVKKIFDQLINTGHEVTADWTLTDDIPEDGRDQKSEYVRSIAKRDFEGIRECDIFALLSDPEEGRSMYVELGIALSMYQSTGRPKIFIVGPKNNESVFYFHPLVDRVNTIEDILKYSANLDTIELPSKSHEGRLEEYKSLRAEMLEIIKERVWGQATYAALSAGMLALMKDSGKIPILIFTILLSLPFIFHTMQREHARIRMGNYLRAVLEPKIPGMYWEEYLGLWRGKFGQEEGKGFLNIFDRIKHLISFSGLYLLVSGFCLVYLFFVTKNPDIRFLGIFCFIFLIGAYVNFFLLYGKGQKEYKELLRLGPKA
ncbi:hypothetical protein [Desulfosarcina ovata]|uniref:Uncharacterized protein n=1 Tax=Desulfosarcina ovata subsp. ovata TaxID=2752305 RepID=A0A5K8AEM6_9BACT|nr:hypothetical protein [Desulfosarcina ovata]BBO90989.1 hypothetical protein DSCOOX_41690 [Desulfosarcina ovata subsp. ovata]